MLTMLMQIKEIKTNANADIKYQFDGNKLKMSPGLHIPIKATKISNNETKIAIKVRAKKEFAFERECRKKVGKFTIPHKDNIIVPITPGKEMPQEFFINSLE